MAERRYHNAVLGLMLLVAAIGALHCSNSNLQGIDDVTYVNLAETLVSGQGYQVTFLAHGLEPHKKFPPVFPLMLAPVAAIFGHSVIWYKLITLAAAVIAVPVVFGFLRRIADPRTALLATLVSVTSPFYIYHAAIPLSEIVYLLYSFLALLLVVAYFESEAPWRSEIGIFASVAVVLTCFTRSIGVTLLGGIVLYAVFRWRDRFIVKKLAVALLPAVILLAIWFPAKSGHFAGVGADADYVPPKSSGKLVSNTVHTVKGNVVTYTRIIPETLVPIWKMLPSDNWQSVGPWMLLGVAASYLAVVGAVTRALKWGLDWWYLVCYGGVLALWPWHDARFVIPVLPILLCYVLLGGREMLASFKAISEAPQRRPWPLTLAIVLSCLLVGALLVRQGRSPHGFSAATFGELKKPLLLTPVAALGLLFLAWRGFRLAVSKACDTSGPWIAGVCLAGLLAVNLIADLRPPYGVSYSPAYRSYLAACEFLKENTPPESSVASTRPFGVYYWAERKGEGVPRKGNSARMVEVVDKYKVNYLLLMPKIDTRKFDPFVKVPGKEKGLRFKLIYDKDDARIYEVIRSAAG